MSRDELLTRTIHSTGFAHLAQTWHGRDGLTEEEEEGRLALKDCRRREERRGGREEKGG